MNCSRKSLIENKPKILYHMNNFNDISTYQKVGGGISALQTWRGEGEHNWPQSLDVIHGWQLVFDYILTQT
jgi:hypothetical protein